jgi:hypothetical protein
LVVAISLSAKRKQIAGQLAEQVDEITRDLGEQTDTVIGNAPRLIDGRELRGWPAVGRVRGVVTDSVVPGSDEHLEELSA